MRVLDFVWGVGVCVGSVVLERERRGFVCVVEEGGGSLVFA